MEHTLKSVLCFDLLSSFLLSTAVKARWKLSTNTATNKLREIICIYRHDGDGDDDCDGDCDDDCDGDGDGDANDT